MIDFNILSHFVLFYSLWFVFYLLKKKKNKKTKELDHSSIADWGTGNNFSPRNSFDLFLDENLFCNFDMIVNFDCCSDISIATVDDRIIGFSFSIEQINGDAML